jgi:hypothetical protein
MIFLADEPKPLENVERLTWETPEPPSAEMR